jgi:pilus assembly protein TadC
MNRGKFAWEREDSRFREKRALLADSLIETKVGLLLMGISLGLLLFLFLLLSTVFFRGYFDYIALPFVLVLYVAIALLGERILGLKQLSQTEQNQTEQDD